jgi:3-hydroxybutyrate dehydrogenase
MTASQPHKLGGKRVAITGAASGIGAACARAFAHTGAHPILIDISEGPVAELAAELGGTALLVDLGLLDDVAALALYLAGPAAAMINGASFPLDGGWTQ